MSIPTRGPFRWRWGKIAGACVAGRPASGLSAMPAALFRRAPLLALLGTLALRDLARPDSRIKQLARSILGSRLITKYTSHEVIDAEIVEGPENEAIEGPGKKIQKTS